MCHACHGVKVTTPPKKFRQGNMYDPQKPAGCCLRSYNHLLIQATQGSSDLKRLTCRISTYISELYTLTKALFFGLRVHTVGVMHGFLPALVNVFGVSKKGVGKRLDAVTSSPKHALSGHGEAHFAAGLPWRVVCSWLLRGVLFGFGFMAAIGEVMRSQAKFPEPIPPDAFREISQARHDPRDLSMQIMFTLGPEVCNF